MVYVANPDQLPKKEDEKLDAARFYNKKLTSNDDNNAINEESDIIDTKTADTTAATSANTEVETKENDDD